MSFQISPLPSEQFSYLAGMSDAELRRNNIKKVIADANPGYPCRVSLEDAAIGETLFLLNYAHLDKPTPYRASHAIYVRENAVEACLSPGYVPQVLRTRLLSVRAFDTQHDMVHADVVDGQSVEQAITTAFADPDVAYLHLHNAKPGCFAARVDRA